MDYMSTKPKRSNTTIWLLIVALLLSLIFAGYEKGRFSKIFDIHAKEKVAIAEQIERTYCNITNGAYTSQTIQGGGIDGLPFYNQNFQDVMVMGLLPLANIFGFKVTLEAKNIDVYSFIDDHTAQVKYDVIATTENSRDSVRIEMEVKKIGGLWKLDGTRALGFDSTGKSPKYNIFKDNASEDNTLKYHGSNKNNIKDDNYIKKEFLNNSDNKAWKVDAYSEGTNRALQEKTDDMYFIFIDKKIYIINAGKIERVLHETRQYMDNEDAITETKEGYRLSQFGDITLTSPEKISITYEVEDFPASEVYLQSQYTR